MWELQILLPQKLLSKSQFQKIQTRKTMRKQVSRTLKNFLYE